MLLAVASQSPDTTDLREASRAAVAAAFVLINEDEPYVRDARHIVIDQTAFKKLARARGDTSSDWSSLKTVVGSRGVSDTLSDCAPLVICPIIKATVFTRTATGTELTIRVLQVNTFSGRGELAVNDYV